MEFDKLSNQVIGDCEDGIPDELQCHQVKSGIKCFVLIVSFVVKRFCAFARILLPRLFLFTHSKRQRAKKRPLSL
jgi:hypothetical protein